MNIQHKILSFHPETGSILVNYYCDEIPDGLSYNIDIPVVNGSFVGQDEIDKLIEAFKPTGQLMRLAEIKLAEVPEHLAQHVKPVVENQTLDFNNLPPHELAKAISEMVDSGQSLTGVAPNDTIQFLDAK